MCSGIPNKLYEKFTSDEGCRILSNVISDECKMAQDLKKILEKRLSLDEQYAKNLLDLATSVNRFSWPIDTHPIASVTRKKLDRKPLIYNGNFVFV